MRTQIHADQKKSGLTRILYLCLSVAFLSVFISALLAPRAAHAAPNIDANDRWAWNDVVGWIDFGYAGNQNVEVADTELRGYASSSVGFISLNCASGPQGSNCSAPYSVTNTNGALAGYAWNDAVGYISFNCSNTGTCGTISYSVRLVNGEFAGYAWNDAVGYISFNCSNTGTCGTINYKVKTTWIAPPATGLLLSNIFDSGTAEAVFQTIFWRGTLNGGEAKFQIASSNNSAGPWNYVGSDVSEATYYGGGTIGPDTQIPLGNHHSGRRYVRYKIFITAIGGGSPQIDSISITYTK